MVVRCFGVCLLLSVTVRTVQRRFAFDSASTPTSRMTGGTGKPSLLRAALLVVVVVAVCHFTHVRACTPAVIWCPHESPDYDAAYRTAPSSPLQKLTTEEFESSLTQFNDTEPIVVSELCVEDLRNSKVSPLSPPGC